MILNWPLLLLDAPLPPDIVRYFVPRLQVIDARTKAAIAAAMLLYGWSKPFHRPHAFSQLSSFRWLPTGWL